MQSRLLVAVLVLGACGDDGVHHLADAPPAPDDAPLPDAPTSGAVTLTITRFAQPQENVAVYFQAANGTLVATKMTDATGAATATMEPGGYVTAVNPFAGGPALGGISNEVRTFAGVKPGDHLVLQQGGSFITVTVNAPIDPLAASYEVYSSCGSSGFTSLPSGGSGAGPSGVVTLDGCGSSADFTVVTRDGNGGTLHYFTLAGVTVTDGGTIDLTSGTYADLADTQLMYAGAPAETTGLAVQYVLASARGPIYSTGSFVGLEGGDGNVTLARPAGGALALVDTRFDPPGASEQHVVDWTTPAATFPIALGTGALPAYTASPSIDTATHTLSWTAGAGETPDAVMAQMYFSREGTPGVSWSWTVSAPYASTSFVLPKLDVAITQFNPIAGDTGSVDDLLTAKVPGGYDAMRALLQSSDGPQTFVAGGTGRIAYTHLNFQVTTRKRW